MKLKINKLNNISLILVLVVTAIVVNPASHITASTHCAAQYPTLIQLSGYARASALPLSKNGISLAGVTYNRITREFSGKGYNDLVGSITFKGNTAEVDSLNLKNASSRVQRKHDLQWGHWNGIIEGLDKLEYNQSTGKFTLRGERSLGPRNIKSDLVDIGLGLIYFDNGDDFAVDATGTITAVSEECTETIETNPPEESVSINCSSRNTRREIAISPESRNVNGCTAQSQGIESPTTITGTVTPNSPLSLTVYCTGAFSGELIRKSVTISCIDDPDNPDGPDNPPDGPEGTVTPPPSVNSQTSGIRYNES